jgi:hypothetical protein
VNRSGLAEKFSASTQIATKTFVLEAHPPRGQAPHAYLAQMAGEESEVQATDDSFLLQIVAEDVELWVDTLDKRFWSFHSWSNAASVKRYLKDRVERHRNLDFVWLPSDHLRNVWDGAHLSWLRSDFRGERLLPGTEVARDVRVQVRGHDSEDLLDYLAANVVYRPAVAFDRVGFRADSPELGVANEAVDRLGHFAAAGNSFELHQEVVRGVVRRYSRLVRLIEERALRFEALEAGGFLPSGTPILLRLSRQVPDMGVFLDGLFSAREPFRLWGAPVEGPGDTWTVDAVDLHVGQRISFDVGDDWLRVYLPAGACGNTVVRLVANLQHRFDANVQFADPDLQAALKPRASAATGS